MSDAPMINTGGRAECMSLRDWFAGMALQGLVRDGIVNSAIPSLAKATGRDAEWRSELITAAAASAYDLADATLAQRETKP